jgi:hypothetical protein
MEDLSFRTLDQLMDQYQLIDLHTHLIQTDLHVKSETLLANSLIISNMHKQSMSNSS